VLGFLVVKFGPGIVNLVTAVMARHLVWIFVAFVVLIALIASHLKFRKSRASGRQADQAV